MIYIAIQFIKMKYNNENMLQNWYWIKHYILTYN